MTAKTLRQYLGRQKRRREARAEVTMSSIREDIVLKEFDAALNKVLASVIEEPSFCRARTALQRQRIEDTRLELTLRTLTAYSASPGVAKDGRYQQAMWNLLVALVNLHLPGASEELRGKWQQPLVSSIAAIQQDLTNLPNATRVLAGIWEDLKKKEKK